MISTTKMIALLSLFTIQPVSVSSRPMLIVQSAFFKHLPRQPSLSSHHDELTILRGGGASSYEDYNDDNSNYCETAEGGYDTTEYYPRYDESRSSHHHPDYDDYEKSYSRRRNDNGYYDDEGRYYQEYEGEGRSRRRTTAIPSKSKLPTVLTSGNRKLGIIFLSSGAALTALGITLFFNKTLMRMGNLLFVTGIPLTIGPGRTLGYFLQPKKARATGCLAVGIFLVLAGHPVIGILLEIFGLLNLFGNMFPVLLLMAKNLPVVGGLFGGEKNGTSSSSSSGKRRRRDEDDEYYYGERYGADHVGEREQWQERY